MGFKIFIHQARQNPAKKVWTYLKNDPTIKVIHLSRKNRFKRVLSHEVASAKGSWVASDDNTDDVTINLSSEQWLEKLEIDAVRERRIEKLFSQNPKVHIYYENLVDDWEGSTRSIQGFLGVEPKTLEKKLSKQELKRPSERCANYSDLVEYFSNTKFNWMFEEEIRSK